MSTTAAVSASPSASPSASSSAASTAASTGFSSTVTGGVRRFTVADLPAEPWRNGGGQTRQIAAAEAVDGGWDWRVSLADIGRGGAFSLFPGIARQALLAQGRRLGLRAGDAVLAFDRLGDGHAFEGELALTAELGDGPVRLFNVMTRRGRATAAVTAHRGSTVAAFAKDGTSLSAAEAEAAPPQAAAARVSLSFTERDTLVLLVASGEFRLSVQNAVAPVDLRLVVDDGLQVHGLAGTLQALGADACLLLAQLRAGP